MAHCSVSTKIAFFAAGVGIGALVALLFAPQSGEETRKQIAEKAQDGKDYVASMSRDLVDQGKDLVGKQKARLADVLESGKQAARDAFAR